MTDIEKALRHINAYKDVATVVYAWSEDGRCEYKIVFNVNDDKDNEEER